MARVSTWRLELGPIAAGEFPSWATDQLLARLQPRADALRAAVAEVGARSAITFAGAYGDVVPQLVIQSELIAQIAELGSWLDFSLMVVREDTSFLEF